MLSRLNWREARAVFQRKPVPTLAEATEKIRAGIFRKARSLRLDFQVGLIGGIHSSSLDTLSALTGVQGLTYTYWLPGNLTRFDELTTTTWFDAQQAMEAASPSQRLAWQGEYQRLIAREYEQKQAVLKEISQLNPGADLDKIPVSRTDHYPSSIVFGGIRYHFHPEDIAHYLRTKDMLPLHRSKDEAWEATIRWIGNDLGIPVGYLPSPQTIQRFRDGLVAQGLPLEGKALRQELHQRVDANLHQADLCVLARIYVELKARQANRSRAERRPYLVTEDRLHKAMLDRGICREVAAEMRLMTQHLSGYGLPKGQNIMRKWAENLESLALYAETGMQRRPILPRWTLNRKHL